MKKLFGDMTDQCEDIFHDVVHYGINDGFYINTSDGMRETIGYALSVEVGIEKKGIPWSDIGTILFDEFLEIGRRLEDETRKFQNIISTVCREREGIQIIMCANSVAKISPYWDLFGISLRKLKQGEIYTVIHESGVTASVEWCKSPKTKDGKRITNPYTGFDDDPTTSMILYGSWDYDKMNISDVDGIGWNSKRKLFPCYFTALEEVFELSVYMSANPVVFVRKVNTQKGQCREEIKYNISYDNSAILVNKKGVIPMYSKFNDVLMPQKIISMWKIIVACIDTKRFVCDKMESGSDFMKIYDTIKGA